MNNMNCRHTGYNQYDKNRCQKCGCNKTPAPSMPQNNGCMKDCCKKNNGCDADSSMHNDPLCGMPIGIGYVPWQQWEEIYDVCNALKAGTMFPSLNLPFYGCVPHNCGKKGGTL